MIWLAKLCRSDLDMALEQTIIKRIKTNKAAVCLKKLEV